jgi:anthranilate synthase component 1
MAVLKDRQVYVQAGAGIVADSVPEKEYQECLRKADAIINALERAGKAAVI